MELRDLFFGVVVVLLLASAYLVLRPFVAYVVGAGLLAFVLLPVQRRIAPRLGPRVSAFVLVVFAVVVTVVPFALLIVYLVRNAADESDDLVRRPVLDRLERALEGFGLTVEIPSEVTSVPDQFTGVFVGELSNVLGATVRIFLGFSLLLFLSYYLLVDGERLAAWLYEAAPLPEAVQSELYPKFYLITWAVLKGHVFVGLAQGVIGGLGLFVAGVPDAPLWTLAMILFAFVPIVGVAAVWVPAGLYLLLTGQTFAGVGLLVYGATIISWVDNYLRAIIVTRGAEVHPGVVLVGVLGGVYFLGALGLFVGPIILALSEATVRIFVEHYGLARS